MGKQDTTEQRVTPRMIKTTLSILCASVGEEEGRGGGKKGGRVGGGENISRTTKEQNKDMSRVTTCTHQPDQPFIFTRRGSCV